MNFITNNDNELNDLKIIIKNHVNHILELQKELTEYKLFYNAVMNNNVINEKFNEYENKIKVLEEEIIKISG